MSHEIGKIAPNELVQIRCRDFWEDFVIPDDYDNCYEVNEELFQEFFNDKTCTIEAVATLLNGEPYDDLQPVITNISPFRIVFLMCLYNRIICNETDVCLFNSLCKTFTLQNVDYVREQFEIVDARTPIKIFGPFRY